MRKFDFTEILTETIEELSMPDQLRGMMHQHRDGEPIPSSKALEEVIDLARSILFPGYYGHAAFNSRTVAYHTGVYMERLFGLLSKQILAALQFIHDCQSKEQDIDAEALNIEDCRQHAKMLTAQFIRTLPQMRRVLATDVMAAYTGDPAATSCDEIICCYPAIKAITNYRIAHALLELEIPLLPRIITEMAHSETGIDIHPAAQIGESFTIDHGTGVVIGATSVIGNNVKLYQGVTLGAKSFPLDENGKPIKGILRHPILEDDVVVYANSTILGRITIGKGSVIGGNIWVTNSIPPGSSLVQAKK